MRTLAIIQARMGSTRLPGKVLKDIVGKPLIARVIDRTRAARGVDAVVVATTESPEDDALVRWIDAKGGCPSFRGPMDDVLARYYLCAQFHEADIVVRVTADDPLKDPRIIERALQLLVDDSRLDYCSNTMRPTYPEGLDIEVFRFHALERAYREAQLPSDREHVTPYIWKNPGKFNVLNFAYSRDLSSWRWTVDKPEDILFMERVYRQFVDTPLVSFESVIEWLDDHPKIREINSGTLRNEGYLKSIQSEMR